MEENELILDEGKIRRCPKNLVILGYWKTYWLFFGYKEALEEYVSEEMLEALLLLLHVIVYTVLFPIIPFLRALICWRKAARDVKKESANRIKRGSTCR